MADISKPKCVVNIESNLSSLASDRLIIDVKADSVKTVRILPPVDPRGHIFVKSLSHYRLQDEEGESRALACLTEHGTDETGKECWLCKLIEVAKSGDIPSEAATLILGKGGLDNGIQQAKRFFGQVVEREGEGADFRYIGPKLLALPKTPVEDILNAMKVQQKKGRPLALDETKGQDIDISRTGSGRKTKYRVDLTGDVSDLNDIFPDWEDKKLPDIIAALKLKVYAPEIQKQFAQRTFGDLLDWEMLAEMGL